MQDDLFNFTPIQDCGIISLKVSEPGLNITSSADPETFPSEPKRRSSRQARIKAGRDNRGKEGRFDAEF